MKLHSDSNPALNTVTAYGEGYVEINRERYEGTVAFGPEGAINVLAIRTVTDITSELLLEVAHVKRSANADPFAALDAPDAIPVAPPGGTQVLLVGTGVRQHFLRPEITHALLHAGVGLESMDTQAAARTYNILMAEGRRVIALLLPA